MSDEPRPYVARRYHWLAVLPAVGMLGGVPLVNRVHPLVLGLPLLLAWIVGWVVATSVIVGVIYALDRARDGEAGAPPPPSSSPGGAP